MWRNRQGADGGKSFTLEHNGLVVRRGDLVEYRGEEKEQLLAAMVMSVSTISYAGYGSCYSVGTQLISMRKLNSRRLPRAEDLTDAQIGVHSFLPRWITLRTSMKKRIPR